MNNVPTPDMEENMLQDMYAKLLALPIFFKEIVGKECNWSTPTFYRKVRKGKFSNAQRDKILTLFGDIVKLMGNYLEQYRKDLD